MVRQVQPVWPQELREQESPQEQQQEEQQHQKEQAQRQIHLILPMR
jgi:hypothetical protein